MKLFNQQVYNSKLFSFYLFIFFSTVTMIFYFSSLNNFYVLDDFVRLRVASEGALSENFHFFPIPLLTYRIIYLLFGAAPVPLRVLNYLLNGLMCVMVFKFAILLMKMFMTDISEKKIFVSAFISALYFCVHYVHVETIVYYSELHEMFYSIFYFVGLYQYLKFKYEKKRIYLFYVFLSYLMCILSKETAVTFILCITLLDLLYFKERAGTILVNYYPLAVITIAFVLVRYFFFPSLDVLNKPESFGFIIAEIIKNYTFSFTAFIFSLDFIHLKNIYKTNNQNYAEMLFNVWNNYAMAVVAIAFSIVIYISVLVKKIRVQYFLFTFVVIVISSFAWLTGYERYLYLPSAGFCIMITIFFSDLKIVKKYSYSVLYIVFSMIFAYNIFYLEYKESQWITASEISRKTVHRIIEVTKDLPKGSVVYFKNLPGEYKSAWVLRYGIHEIPNLFLKRDDIEFLYFYQKSHKLEGENIYEYEYFTDKLYKL